MLLWTECDVCSVIKRWERRKHSIIPFTEAKTGNMYHRGLQTCSWRATILQISPPIKHNLNQLIKLLLGILDTPMQVCWGTKLCRTVALVRQTIPDLRHGETQGLRTLGNQTRKNWNRWGVNKHRRRLWTSKDRNRKQEGPNMGTRHGDTGLTYT